MTPHIHMTHNLWGSVVAAEEGLRHRVQHGFIQYNFAMYTCFALHKSTRTTIDITKGGVQTTSLPEGA